jgi:hypothetical protein
MSDLTVDKELLFEDWYDVLRRPGMNVLATFLSGQLSNVRAQLEDPIQVNSYEKVCELRGELRGFKKVTGYIKKEYDRAAKGDTPEKEH